MTHYVPPVKSLDFEQVQVQIQLAQLTPENLLPYQAAESARIKQKLDARLDQVLRKAVVVVDGSCDLMPSPAIRKLQADWMAANKDLLRLVVHKMVFVVPSDLLRGALTAVTWMAPMPFDVHVEQSLERALDWAIAEVDKIGGDIASELLMGGVEAIERHRIAAEQAFEKATLLQQARDLRRPAAR